MDRDLEDLPSTNESLLAVAARYARDAQAQCVDVSEFAFPSGLRMPSEEMISSVATKLRAIIQGIEKALLEVPLDTGNSDPNSWALLTKSGFLKEPALIDFVLARYAEERLAVRILAKSERSVTEQLPAMMLSHGEATLADTAQAILASESLSRHSTKSLYRELSPELLHLLVWRVVAALQIISGVKNPHHISEAKKLLAEHDESQSARVAARKLVHFLPEEYLSDATDPEKAGLPVFVASMAAQTGLEYDHILRLIDGHSSTPLAAILKICSLSHDQAMAVICLFKGFDLTPYEVNIFEENYDSLEIEQLEAEARSWADERIKFLTFPDMNRAVNT
jgi:hypothetical protein